jgi:peptide/nickel transport system permease protein
MNNENKIDKHKSSTRWLIFFRRNPTLLPGILFLFLIVLTPIVLRTFIDLKLSKSFAVEVNLPPSKEHLLGTQSEGRDVLANLIVSIPATLQIGLVGSIVTLIFGAILGLFSGYFGGRVDSIIRSIVDIGLTIPPLAILIIVAASFPVVSLTMWMFPTRVIRSQVLSMRERGYVQLAKLSGASDLRVIFSEITPNLLPFLFACFVDSVSVTLLTSIGLEVLGLGAKQAQTLGTMIYYAILYAAMWRGMWWWWLPPILVLVLLFLGLFLISMAFDEFANPRLRRG